MDSPNARDGLGAEVAIGALADERRFEPELGLPGSGRDLPARRPSRRSRGASRAPLPEKPPLPDGFSQALSCLLKIAADFADMADVARRLQLQLAAQPSLGLRRRRAWVDGLSRSRPGCRGSRDWSATCRAGERRRFRQGGKHSVRWALARSYFRAGSLPLPESSSVVNSASTFSRNRPWNWPG